ncbi:hypothetical protein FDP41_013093 [Naegleria fowleri]|uniref:Alpha-ketoglutarate-dependent dioxygenase AlkB-like domain-containing protein n=1 Tax=Naegleria fowleri TaxID=5763 RepID=A0A6A5C423_NAEFO|nr:uncharacterized protein FDP41_013093 [Naegleria fowleri]KAF0980610.1 hypothetical protein FDP41_013093 [Naegleria fowleri]CAG4715369.1 unnamed protein product [Naegleria fowleri]
MLNPSTPLNATTNSMVGTRNKKEQVPVQKISGLFYVRNFISHEESQQLLSHMDHGNGSVNTNHRSTNKNDTLLTSIGQSECMETPSPWKTEIMSRRTQQFGYHFNYFTGELKKIEKSNSLEMNSLGIPLYLQSLVERVQQEHARLNLVNVSQIHDSCISQIILNEYCGPYQYIKKHADSLHFGPIISIVSILQPCVMILYEVSQDGLPNQNITSDHHSGAKLDLSVPIKDLKPTGNRSSIVLEPNSLLILSGLARYRWKHEIISLKDYEKHGFSLKEVIGTDSNEESYRRVSITMRSVVSHLEK